jgi:hypothetical protein
MASVIEKHRVAGIRTFQERASGLAGKLKESGSADHAKEYARMETLLDELGDILTDLAISFSCEEEG